MAVLCVKIAAPLQSWGTSQDGVNDRGTRVEPTFSAVVGMIANAMGRTREQDISDLTQLEFGVRTEVAGGHYSDYYTAGAGELYNGRGGVAEVKEAGMSGGRRVFRAGAGKTMTGHKEYLAGAVFVVGLSGDPQTLRAAKAALDAPARPLYAGRRACPVVPLTSEVTDRTLSEALGGEGAVAVSLPVPFTDPLAEWVYDVPLSFASRQFLPRTVRRVRMAPKSESESVGSL